MIYSKRKGKISEQRLMKASKVADARIKKAVVYAKRKLKKRRY